jgi:hypothetical protein
MQVNLISGRSMTSIITPEAIFTAANELHASGQAVTVKAVITAIGGGSSSTVGVLLKAWRSIPNCDDQGNTIP